MCILCIFLSLFSYIIRMNSQILYLYTYMPHICPYMHVCVCVPRRRVGCKFFFKKEGLDAKKKDHVFIARASCMYVCVRVNVVSSTERKKGGKKREQNLRARDWTWFPTRSFWKPWTDIPRFPWSMRVFMCECVSRDTWWHVTHWSHDAFHVFRDNRSMRVFMCECV